LLDAVRPRIGAAPAKLDVPPLSESGAGLNLAALAQAFNAAVRGKEFCLTRLPLGWNGAYAHFRHPLNYIGYDGGAGVGSVSCTSSAAPRMRPAASSSTRAALSTRRARAVFTNQAPGFMRDRSAREIRPSVSRE